MPPATAEVNKVKKRRGRKGLCVFWGVIIMIPGYYSGRPRMRPAIQP